MLLTDSVSAMVEDDSDRLSGFGMKYAHGSRGSEVVSLIPGSCEGGEGDIGDCACPDFGVSGATGGIGNRSMRVESTCRKTVLKCPGIIAG